MLSGNDYRGGLRLLQQLSTAAIEEGAFARRGVELLPRLVASEVTTLSVCHLASGRREVVGSPNGAISVDDRACFDRHFNEHPLVRYHAYLRGPDTHRISDSVPFARFRESALYNEYYRRVGIDHAIALPLHVEGDLLVSFVLNRRRRDFSDRDRDLLELLREGLSALYRQATLLQRARVSAGQLAELLTSTSLGAIRIDEQGKVRDCSAKAVALLRRFCGHAPAAGADLPSPLDGLLARFLTSGSGVDTEQMFVQRGTAGLRVHVLPAPETAGGMFVLLEECSDSELQVDRWPLTAREREVLQWLAGGKTDRDIGAILRISPRTVHKHLQRIYAKLGVETRTAAVMRALGAPDRLV
jgi:DNA-binding CsgD family transcriptional regulator/PAS domain-containing protein